ncbi:esterase B1-like [Chironomus tepperi]|uniref:esterase B1-like n=1 Tax=Chironomus tepperi TaxID=113505 RepID=UPI00391F8CF8
MENFEIVQTEFGPIKGIHKKLVYDNDCITFQSIPYMKPPVGNLRFREAQPTDKWEEPFDATGEILAFPSYYEGLGNLGQEDAGILNIFTKNLKPEKPTPVMVWIHGGGFFVGSSKTDTYGPDYFMQEDIIFVSFNYRLGVLGFLSLEDESLGVPGNNGLKDQIFALKWIKRNIANFGGDPNNITIFGESAGGASVHMLSISEQSKGLYQRAIAMSGTSLCQTWGLIPQSTCRKHAERLAEKLGWTGQSGDQKSLLDFLEKPSADEIVKVTNDLLTPEEKLKYGFYSPFTPVVEPYITENCLIPEDPIKMMETCWTNDIDILFTGNSLEGVLRNEGHLDLGVEIFNNPAYALPLLELQLDPSDQRANELGLKIKNLYFNDQMDPKESFIRHGSELMFWVAIYRAIQSRIKHAKGKSYLVRFDAEGGRNFVKQFFKCNQYKGAGHGDELGFIFTSVMYPPLERDSVDYKIMSNYVSILTSFAITGSPNSDEIKPLTLVELNDPDNIKCLQITESSLRVIELPEEENLKVWSTIYEDN